jgi:hypothetical protein
MAGNAGWTIPLGPRRLRAPRPVRAANQRPTANYRNQIEPGLPGEDGHRSPSSKSDWRTIAPRDRVLKSYKTTKHQMESALAAADHLLCKVPLIDGHNDLAGAARMSGNLGVADLDRVQPSLRTGFARLQNGCVGGQFWCVVVPCRFKGADAIAATIEQIEFGHRMIDY